jgi:phage baseplate assembly protein W
MNKQFYGIKFPFSEESDRLTFLDLNENKLDGIKSMLLHIILTPKGQRLRQPNFGTDLIKFIFEPNESNVWDNVKDEIRKQVNLYLPDVIFDNINVIHKPEDVHTLYVEIDYSVRHNGQLIKNKTLVKL